MVCDDGFEHFEVVGTEATQIIVECVDARYGATGQVLEQRGGSKPFALLLPSVVRRTFWVPSAFEVFVIANEATSASGPKFLLVSFFYDPPLAHAATRMERNRG
jgi:hypothetical protein